MTPRAWRALVVDDNAINLEVAVDLLGHLGLQTDSASDGAQAVAQAQAVAYDLIVMDVQMPGMDGREATRRIRRAGGPQPPIIALTANADANDLVACLAAGMNDYLCKPVQPTLLLQTLQRCLPGWVAADHLQPAGLESGGLAGRLAAINDFDLASSLNNLGGQLPQLERVLQRFAQTYRSGEPRLLQAASQGETAELWQVCHSLRGACAVLCSTALVQQIEALEAALGEPLSAAELLDRVRPLQAKLLALARQLDAALASA